MLVPDDSLGRLLRNGVDPEKMAEEYLAVFEEFPGKVRIETQIHRRRAARALSRLTLEWEQAQPALPDQRIDQEQR